MAKTKISEWSTTPSSNTDIDGINIAEGCAPSGINDAIRDLMAQVRSWQSGASGDPFNGPMNGTIGSTTAYSGAFTTLSASGTVTLSGGTANGVAYLNGSKVVTSGSALTFDGSKLAVSGAGIGGADDRIFTVTNTAANSYGAMTLVGTSRGGYLNFYNGATAQAAIVGQASALSFYVGTDSSGSQSMILTSTGLGIGTSSPQAKLQVLNSIKVSSSDQSSGNVILGDGSSTNFNVGIARWNGSTNAAGTGGMGYFAQGPTNSGGHFWYTGDASAGSTTKQMTLDTSGNLGLGVTPSAWSNNKAIEVGAAGNAIYGYGASNVNFTCGAYYNSGWKYAVSGTAVSYYNQSAGLHQWYTAPLGTAGNAITFTQAMTLDSSGSVQIGTTTAYSGRLTVQDRVNGTVYSVLRNSYFDTGACSAAYTFNLGNGFAYMKGSIPSANSGSTSLEFHVSSVGSDVTAATIDSSGNLGVGTTSPTQTVSVGLLSGTKGFNIVYPPSSAELACFTANASTGEVRIGGTGGTYFPTFYSNGSERARIDASGNLLVGTTSAAAVNKGFAFLPDGLGTGISVGQIGHASGTASGNGYLQFLYNNGAIGSITQSGTTAVLYNLTSDQRLKENIQDAESASSLIDAIQVRQFDWKSDNSHQRYGFVAQELVTVAPEAVHQPADPDEMMAVDYSKLVPMLVKEIQSLRKRLADAGI